MSPAAQPASDGARTIPKRGTATIGGVLARLQEEFPDITVSKIRYLETEGLLNPQRTPAGYRRFAEEDVQRLRTILMLQRDSFMPLKVIREHLAALDSGEVAGLPVPAAGGAPVVSPENFRTDRRSRLTDTEVARLAGVDAAFVAELIAAKLLVPDAAGFLADEDVAVARAVEALEGYGLEVRHLRSLRTAARRHAELIGQVARPLANRPEEGAAARADETARELSALIVSLHAALVKNAVREELDQ